jgi:nucleoside phosphorylase
MPPKIRDEFEIAIICALTLEADAVEALFDETYDKFGKFYGRQFGDQNTYITGRIGPHNIVLCHLPGMGIGSAAGAAANLRVSYNRIQLALVVGICGAVPFPSSNTEIVLGDIIVSDSVIQYDFSRQYPNGFRRKSDVKETLGRPSQEIRAFLAGLRGRKTRSELQEQTYKHLQTLQALSGTEWLHPGTVHDVLFEASYRHKHYQQEPVTKCICFGCKSSSDPVCDDALKKDCKSLGCAGNLVQRSRLGTKSVQPYVYIGTIASANTVMKSGEHRDKLAETEDVIGFEMEGAGVWDNLPCIIIKGVCDYADSHKNKVWQDYAAATAASCAKAFLGLWPATTKQCT